MSDNELHVNVDENRDPDRNFKIKAAVFLATVTGVSAVAGFAHTLSQAKKYDPILKNNGLPRPGMESGAMLATRALGWGTFYAVTGVGVICFSIFKLSGAKDWKDFRQIMGSKLPRITKTENQGRTEFASFRELIQYLSEEKGKSTKSLEK